MKALILFLSLYLSDAKKEMQYQQSLQYEWTRLEYVASGIDYISLKSSWRIEIRENDTTITGDKDRCIKDFLNRQNKLDEQLWAAQELLYSFDCIEIPDNRLEQYMRARVKYFKVMGWPTNDTCKCK